MTTELQATRPKELLSVVSDPRRRSVLRYLSEYDDGEAGVDELAARLRADRDRRGGPAGTNGERITLEHVHLPKLAEAGVVTYDADEGTVRYHHHESVEKLLRFVAEELERGPGGNDH